MDLIQNHRTDVAAASTLLDTAERRLAAIDPDLRPEALAKRRSEALADLSKPLAVTLASISERQKELAAERLRLSDPNEALFVAAIQQADKAGPGDVLLAGQLREFSPAQLERMAEMVKGKPILLQALRQEIGRRDLDAHERKRLENKVLGVAGAFTDQPRIRALAAAELAGIEAQARYAALKGDRSSGIDKLTLARQKVDLEKLVS